MRNSRVPTDRGPYAAGQERVAHATTDGELVTIHNVRDGVYSADEESEIRWIDEVVDPEELTNIWVYFAHFAPKVTAIAHTEIGFEFADGRCLIVSFEVRPLSGKPFSIIAGLGKNFEMTVRWATERDVITKRLIKAPQSRMYMFEAAITHQRAVELFHAFIARTNALHETPEWYNTVTNTCTTKVVAVVDEVLPGQLSRTPRILLPGMLPKYWSTRGVLRYEGDFATAFEEAFINDRCREIGDVADFSRRLHRRNIS